MNAPDILKYLEMIANVNHTINLLMHLVVLAALTAVFFIKSESLRRILFQTFICLLFISVTIQALMFGNPFHAVTFGLLAIVGIVQLVINKNETTVSANKIQVGVALLSVILGIWYPEFVHKNIAAMLIFAPVGVIPCPTLLAALGLMTIVYQGLHRLQYGFMIFMGFVYGIIGTFVLKVYLDIVLLAVSVFAVYIYMAARPKKIKSNDSLIKL